MCCCSLHLSHVNLRWDDKCLLAADLYLLLPLLCMPPPPHEEAFNHGALNAHGLGLSNQAGEFMSV